MEEEIVMRCLEGGVLLSPELVKRRESINTLHFPKGAVVITHDALSVMKSNVEVDWKEFDRLRAQHEKGKGIGYVKFLDCLYEGDGDEAKVRDTAGSRVDVISSYNKPSKSYGVQDFVQYFTKRYKAIETILRKRPELAGVISIGRVLRKRDKEHIAIIGMVLEKSETKNGNIMLRLEDPTGKIAVLVNKNKPELFEAARDLVLDEVIGVLGVSGEKIVFVNEVFWPDVPYSKEARRAPDEAYAIFLSDLHVGSKYFLNDEFKRFIKWINGEYGNEKQREIARKTSYVFIVGDVIDGVGIYPNQEEELEIKDIYGQYEALAEWVAQIPHEKKIIICPGNHDALRLAEPQPPLDRDFAAALYELPNVVLVSNPAVVNIHSSGGFSGIEVLMYHGYSFDYYVAEVGSIRSNGGYHRADLIMEFLLERRHLAPTYTSTLYTPDPERDPLVIHRVPDIFVTGHIHYSKVKNYRNVTMISGSCWQGLTSFQAKLGHDPEPARVPAVNLKTRDVKILRFT